MASRFALLIDAAPDILAAWSGLAAGRPIEVRREVRRRGGEGSAGRIAEQLPAAEQLRAAADALASVVAGVHGLMHLEQPETLEASPS